MFGGYDSAGGEEVDGGGEQCTLGKAREIRWYHLCIILTLFKAITKKGKQTYKKGITTSKNKISSLDLSSLEKIAT